MTRIRIKILQYALNVIMSGKYTTIGTFKAGETVTKEKVQAMYFEWINREIQYGTVTVKIMDGQTIPETFIDPENGMVFLKERL